ncbi:MAG TPA: phosphodiesterase YaeI [Bryobacteraceae bacterium]|nr:phosphodiesterase YaeI [Bryobacteraceae bacterium]
MIARRQFLWSGALAGVAAAAYPIVVEPRWLDLTFTKVSLAAEGTIVRVLHLSDFHASWAVPVSMIDAAIQMGLSARPDLICLTGDFITHRYDSHVWQYVLALRRLTAVGPVFAVLGNHDGGIWASKRRGYADHSVVDRLLEDAGVTLLHNRAQPMEIKGAKFLLVGVADLWSGELDAARAFRSVRDKERVILLSHNPDSKDALPFAWDLMLCGHTHGGQVIIPFEGPRYAPVVDQRFIAGLYAWNGRQIYITRGVGNLGGVRFRCRPEVTILDIQVA